MMVYTQMTKYLERTQSSKYLQKQWLLSRSLIRKPLFLSGMKFQSYCSVSSRNSLFHSRAMSYFAYNHSGCVHFSCVFIKTYHSVCSMKEQFVPQIKHLCYALTIIFFILGVGGTSMSLLLNFSRFLRSLMNCQFICCQQPVNIENICCSLSLIQWFIRLHL